MEQRIFDIIFKEDEVTWQALLMELVKSEGMDPWDIDVSEISHKYIEMLKKMQEMDLRVSGKVVLAAAVLLKFKSNYLINEEMLNLDRLMHPEDYPEEDLYNIEKPRPQFDMEHAKLIPKTPQPRKRKVSIYDLVEALKQALEVKKRRREILAAVNITVPEKKIDISKIIDALYGQITKHLAKAQSLTFSELVPSKNKADLVGVFLPLLHLSNDQKVELEQETHFGEIDILLPNKSERKSGSALHEVPDLKKQHDFVGDALEESDKNKKKR